MKILDILLCFVLLVMFVGGIVEWQDGGWVALIIVAVVAALYVFKTWIKPGK